MYISVLSSGGIPWRVGDAGLVVSMILLLWLLLSEMKVGGIERVPKDAEWALLCMCEIMSQATRNGSKGKTSEVIVDDAI